MISIKEDYSEKSFVVYGDDTIKIMSELKKAGGAWNAHLKKEPNAGWVFPNTKLDAVKSMLFDYVQQESAPKQNSAISKRSSSATGKPTSKAMTAVKQKEVKRSLPLLEEIPLKKDFDFSRYNTKLEKRGDQEYLIINGQEFMFDYKRFALFRGESRDFGCMIYSTETGIAVWIKLPGPFYDHYDNGSDSDAGIVEPREKSIYDYFEDNIHLSTHYNNRWEEDDYRKMCVDIFTFILHCGKSFSDPMFIEFGRLIVTVTTLANIHKLPKFMLNNIAEITGEQIPITEEDYYRRSKSAKKALPTTDHFTKLPPALLGPKSKNRLNEIFNSYAIKFTLYAKSFRVSGGPNVHAFVKKYGRSITRDHESETSMGKRLNDKTKSGFNEGFSCDILHLEWFLSDILEADNYIENIDEETKKIILKKATARYEDYNETVVRSDGPRKDLYYYFIIGAKKSLYGALDITA